MNFFDFTKSDYERICQECMLDDEYKKLLEYKIKGYSIVKMADEQDMIVMVVMNMVEMNIATMEEVMVVEDMI